MPKIPEIELGPVSDRDLLVMVVQNTNLLTQQQIPQMLELIQQNQSGILDNRNTIAKVKSEIGINGDAPTRLDKVRNFSESKGGIVAIIALVLIKIMEYFNG